MAAAAILLGACGGSSDDAGDGSPGSSGTTNDSAAAEVKTLLSGDVKFPFPTDKVDPGTHNVAVIASGLASPGPTILANNAMDAIKALGWTADAPGDGKFAPTTQAQLIEKAVLDKVEGIILVSVTPEAVDSAIKAAQAADIPIVCALCGPNLSDGIVGVGNDGDLAGKAQAAYAASKAKAGDTVVVYQNTEFKASEQQMKSAAARVKELCPKCNVETPSLLLTESVQPNAPIFTSLLNKNPAGKISSVIVPFDTPASVLSNAAAQLGRNDFNVIGHGGLSPFVDMVGSGTPAVAKADVLISTPYYGWASVDELVRSIAGVDNWEANKMPVGLVDKSTYGNYPKGLPFVLPKFDYEAKFKELWGK
ncbi:hypothetical protein GCM10022234_09250 [Aeromicrobium panaciterrae]